MFFFVDMSNHKELNIDGGGGVLLGGGSNPNKEWKTGPEWDGYQIVSIFKFLF